MFKKRIEEGSATDVQSKMNNQIDFMKEYATSLTPCKRYIFYLYKKVSL